MPATSVRYFTVYGPRQRPDMAFNRFLRAALQGAPISVYGDGEQTRDFTYVDDAVAATILAAERGTPGRAYNIGGGSRVSVNDVLQIVERISGRRLDVRREPAQKGDMRDTYADTSRARAELGLCAGDVAGRRPDGGVPLAVIFSSACMMLSKSTRPILSMLLLAGLAFSTAAGCGAKKDAVPQGTTEPDKFLYEKGNESLEKHRWLTAREYFRRILDTYPQSNYRPDAKLGIGDSYLGENSTESLILAVNEFREFLTFYPTSPRADYAQLKLGMTHYKQMRKPQRDQSETREAIHEFETFVERYPNSALMEEGRQRLREARDRLSTHEYEVGVFYFKQRWYPGAIDRLRALLKVDPGFTQSRRRVLLPRRIADEGEAAGRGAALLRQAACGVRDERVSRAREGAAR